VLDPESAAGLEVRRERRKLRKEEKRAQEEKEEKVRLWKEVGGVPWFPFMVGR
jgi:hypothetical protein